MPTTTAGTANWPPVFLEGEGDEVFRNQFEVAPFLFHHRLAESESFKMDRVRELARRLPGKINFSGQLPIQGGLRQPAGEHLSFEETLRQLETGCGWIILKKVDEDPEYAPLLGQVMSEVGRRVGFRLEPLTESRTMSLILSSPGQVTPYHIDADCNFLVQIHGRKTFYVFNGRDRSVLPEAEEERFWSGKTNAAQYREEKQSEAWEYHLEPGNGVHVPVVFPHWVKNGPEVSVSLSVNFRFHGRLRGDIHRMNHLLRKIGIRPRRVGESRVVDALKRIVIGPPRNVARRVRRVYQRFS